MKRLKVLIVDDSALMRREIRKIFETDPDIEVVAASRNGEEALEHVARLDPDVITLDINMPDMDGLTALQHIMMQFPRPVIMLSSLTQEGSITTYEALELGAVDFVGKPGGTISKNIMEVSNDLIFKVKAAAEANLSKLGHSRKRRRMQAQTAPLNKGPKLNRKMGKEGDKIVVFGQSTGGPNTIFEIIPHLPADLGVPVIIVQHMPGSFTSGFAKRIDESCAFPFKEAADGDVLEPGCGYLAPGDVHTVLATRGLGQKGYLLRTTKYPEGTLHTPSVDVTMGSVLEAYGGPNIIAVLLTGMGADGANAMADIRRSGGRTIAESEETCVVFGMPKEAISRGGAEFVLPSYDIASKIVELVKK
ncbi:MAG: chemotaxis response regulator protein-glutamate methylesterase [Oligoflexia bacterium]|nr:chemotaxis response regulator protein-glutamate methylesterase [Oligoflexia bacterium]